MRPEKLSADIEEEEKVTDSGMAEILSNVDAQLQFVEERIKVLRSQPAAPPPAAVPKQEIKNIVLSPEYIERLLQEGQQARNGLRGNKPVITVAPRVEEYDFSTKVNFCNAEYARIYRQMHVNELKRTSKKQVKPRVVPISSKSKLCSGTGIIEMELQLGSGVNDQPVYRPKLS